MIEKIRQAFEIYIKSQPESTRDEAIRTRDAVLRILSLLERPGSDKAQDTDTGQ